MIPLRLLHVLDPALAAADRAGPASLLPWLAAQGHAVAQIAIGPAALAIPVDCLGRRLGWWQWWRHGRAAAVVAAAAWGADLVHAHGEAALAPGLELARNLAAPLVADPVTLALPATQRLLRDGAIAAVLVPGEEQRSGLLADARVPRDRVVVVPPGVDERLPPPRTGGGDVVVAARLRRRCDAELLAAALTQVRASGLAITVVASLEAGLRRAPLVEGLAVVEPGAELAAADLLVELAEDDRPMGHVVDALASGRPVVAVSEGLLPELVQDGVSGILVPHDVEALAGALRQLAAADRRTACADQARRAARRLGIGIVGEAVLGVYRAGVGGTAAGTATTWKRLTTERLRRRTSDRQRAAGS